MRTTLKDMPVNRNAAIVAVRGGIGCHNRLSAMGLHPGREIRKIGGSFIGGPITVQINGALVVVGEGMAQRIIVEIKPAEASEV
ncbi:MAG: FeoA family protein [Bacillota bacterium]